MLKFHDVKQNSDDWYDLRGGKLTGSNLQKVMANFGKAFGDPAKKLAVNIALEQITGKPIVSDYTNEHMERGHEQEPVARMLYEEETFCDVSNGGFFEGSFVGFSPDGLVGDEGVIEIKSVIPHVHFANIKRQDVDPAYKWQVYGNLMYSGREWIDFVSYCEQFPPGKKLYIYRVYANIMQDEFNMIEERVNQFEQYVETTKDLIIQSEYFIN